MLHCLYLHLHLSDEAEVKHGFHCVLKITFDDVILVLAEFFSVLAVFFRICRLFLVLAELFLYWPSLSSE